MGSTPRSGAAEKSSWERDRRKGVDEPARLPDLAAMEFIPAHILISSAGLYDPNFRHTVVLIGSHDEQGAAGVILNRPTGIAVAEAAPNLVELVGARAELYEGGPVEEEHAVVVAELTGAYSADIPIFGNIGFLTGEIDASVRAAILRARVYAGYSGWGAGQLEEELAEDTWIVEPARAEDVFSDEPDSLWRRVLQRKGGEYRRIAMMPKDPRVN